MGSSAQSGSSSGFTVQRSGTSLSSGNSYVPGETLTITKTGSASQYVFEASGGALFANGACSNTRYSNGQASLVMPSSGTVTVKMGFASGYSTVSITSSFVINAPPTATPTAAPVTSFAPISPTFAPSIAPSAPSGQPSSSPTSSPSISLRPSVAAAILATDDAYKGSSSNKVITGVVVAIVLGLLLLATMRWYLADHEGFLSRYGKALRMLPAIMAICSAGVALGLVSAWASSKTDSDTGYLGKAKWGEVDEFPAFHPALQVGGFFFAQVAAITAWSLLPGEEMHGLAKVIHGLLQSGAVATMIAAMLSITRYQQYVKQPSLTTMHSWVGVMAIVLFGMNYVLGMSMAMLTQFAPESILRRAFDLRSMHKMLGLGSMVLSAAAIVAGVNDQLGQGRCYYKLSSLSTGYTEADLDPAENYPYMPISCRLGNEVGVAVLVSALFTCLTVYTRSKRGKSDSTEERNAALTKVLPGDLKMVSTSEST